MTSVSFALTCGNQLYSKMVMRDKDKVWRFYVLYVLFCHRGLNLSLIHIKQSFYQWATSSATQKKKKEFLDISQNKNSSEK